MTALRQQPPRDEDGRVAPHDHPQIEDDHRVIRRVSEERVVIRHDGRRTLSSQCFKPSSDVTEGLSVDLEAWLIEDEINVEDFVTNPRFTASVAIPVSAARDLNLTVGWDPIEGTETIEPNEYHGEIWGVGRKNKRMQKNLQAQGTWLVPLEGVDVS